MTGPMTSPDLLYIIRANGYFSQAVGNTSFLLWGARDNSDQSGDIGAQHRVSGNIGNCGFDITLLICNRVTNP